MARTPRAAPVRPSPETSIMATRSATTPKLVPLARPESVYLTDNGCCLCGEHLGASAKYTLRDISGQEVLEVTPEVMQEASAEERACLKCEECGKRPSMLH